MIKLDETDVVIPNKHPEDVDATKNLEQLEINKTEFGNLILFIVDRAQAFVDFAE